MDKENGFILPNIIKCEDCGRDIIQCAMIINIYETQINPLCSDCLKISQKKIREREIELDRFKRFKGKKKSKIVVRFFMMIIDALFVMTGLFFMTIHLEWVFVIEIIAVRNL
jgi:hypothetical protein